MFGLNVHLQIWYLRANIVALVALKPYCSSLAMTCWKHLSAFMALLLLAANRVEGKKTLCNCCKIYVTKSTIVSKSSYAELSWFCLEA